MKYTESDIWIIVAKQAKGELTKSEMRAFDHWKESAPEHSLMAEQIAALHNKTEAPSRRYEPDVAKGWQSFRFRTDSEKGLYGQVATVPQAKTHRFTAYQIGWSVAASLVLLIGLGYLFWQTTQEEMIRVATGAQEKVLYTLPDSSQVWLNEKSALSYASNFDQDSRVVYLEGEAFFEIKKAEGRRFTIFSGLARTEVIGTSFNLRAYEGEPVKIQVVTGKVAFSPSEEDNSIFLEPGMEATMNTEQAVVKDKIQDQNFRAWQNREFVFNNTRLAQLIRTLEDNYDIAIELADKNLADCRYTATFKNKELKEILHILSVTGNLNIDFKQTENHYIVTGEGC